MLFVLFAGIQFSCINKDTPTGTGVLQPSLMELYSGDNQSGTVDTRLAKPLAVRVLAANQQPMPRIYVEFASSSGKATFSERTTQTDGNGIAQTYCIFGPKSDTQSVFALYEGVKGSPVVFKLRSLPASASTISLTQSPSKQVIAGSTASISLLITDHNDNPAPNAAVNFRVTKGNGRFAFSSVLTDSNGKVSNVWKVDTLVGQIEAEAALSSAGGASVLMQSLVVPASPARVIAMDGNDQACFTEITAPVTLKAKAIDIYGNDILNVSSMQFFFPYRFASVFIFEYDPSLIPAQRAALITMGPNPKEAHASATLGSAIPADFAFRVHRLVTLAPISVTSDSIQLQWTPTLDLSFSAYRVYKSTAPGVTTSAALIATITDRTIASYNDAGVARGSGIHYYYRIQVAYVNGDAIFTNEELIVP